MLDFLDEAMDAVGSAVSAAVTAIAPRTDPVSTQVNGLPTAPGDPITSVAEPPANAAPVPPAASDQHHDWVTSVFGVDPRSYAASLVGSESPDAAVPPSSGGAS